MRMVLVTNFASVSFPYNRPSCGLTSKVPGQSETIAEKVKLWVNEIILLSR
jgi:hypothetical protein